MGDVIGGIADFVGGAVDWVGGAIDDLGIPVVGDAISWVGDGISSVGGFVGDVAGGVTDMFFSPAQTLPDMVGSMIGGFGPIQASPMPPMPMNILPLDVPFSIVQGGVGDLGGSGGIGGGGVNNIISTMAGQVDSMYANIESQINNLNPDSPTYQKDLQNIQMAMAKFTQLTELLSNLQKDLHDMSMSIIRNIKM
jgi:flagellar capping protein FliD